MVVKNSPSGTPTAAYCQQKAAQFGWSGDVVVVYDKDGNFGQIHNGGNFHLVADEGMTITWKGNYPSFPSAVQTALNNVVGAP